MDTSVRIALLRIEYANDEITLDEFEHMIAGALIEPPPHSFYEYAWQSNGLDCLVLAAEMGHRCGYVRLPNDHPWFGVADERIDAQIHGGLTFAGDRLEDGGWWLGFDCGHAWDARDESIMSDEYRELWGRMPSIMAMGTVKPLKFVIEQCELLAYAITHLTRAVD